MRGANPTHLPNHLEAMNRRLATIYALDLPVNLRDDGFRAIEQGAQHELTPERRLAVLRHFGVSACRTMVGYGVPTDLAVMKKEHGPGRERPDGTAQTRTWYGKRITDGSGVFEEVKISDAWRLNQYSDGWIDNLDTFLAQRDGSVHGFEWRVLDPAKNRGTWDKPTILVPTIDTAREDGGVRVSALQVWSHTRQPAADFLTQRPGTSPHRLMQHMELGLLALHARHNIPVRPF